MAGSRSRLIVAFLAGVAAAPLSPALAQSQVQTASSADGLRLPDVTVTAQKREQSTQDVPMSLSAFSGAELTEAGVQTIHDVARLSPALEVQTNTSPVQSNFRIRRVGNLGNIPTFEPAVGLFVDGAFRSRSIFGVGELFDLERVEILRGPQSTLYGKNTTAGVVGLYTRAPADTLTAKGEITLGQADGALDALTSGLRGTVSGPVSDTVRFSLTGTYAYQDNVMRQALSNGGEDANGVDRMSVRGQLAWDITESLDARLILGAVTEDVRQQTDDLYFDPNGFVAGIILPTFQAAGVSDTCTDNDPHNRISCVRLATTSDLSASEATLLLNYEFANGVTLSSVSSFDTYKFEGSKDDVVQVAAPLLKFHDTQENKSYQQELRLSSPGDTRFDWLLGAFWFSSTFENGDGGNRAIFEFDTLSDDPTVSAINQALLGTPIPLPFATQGQLGFLDSRQETEYFALFGQFTYDLTDRLSVTGGLRWQQEDKDAYVRQSVNDPSPSIISLLLSPPAVSAEDLTRSVDDVTWSLSPQFFVTDDTMVYFTAARGFKSGGFNTGFGALPIDNREFGDETIMHYELGVKTDLADGRVRLNASAFSTEYENYQDAAFIGSQFTVGNAEQADLEGFELEGTALLTENLTADFALSYADFKYATNLNGQCYPGRAPDSPTVPGACDLSGEHPVNAPEWKTHLGLSYDQPVRWGEVFGRVDWSWTDEYNTSFSADPMLTQDAYSFVNLRAGTRWDNFEAAVWVTNLGNETIANFDAVLNIYAGDNSYQSYLQPPRTFGVTLSATF
ncbi:MAG: TonB-dependent receptor [Hyphomonadaceae bacterium]|nr:TonB-dependent receptor [Hyphomonadaceae bacterium]